MKLRKFINFNPGGMEEDPYGGYYRHDLCEFLRIYLHHKDPKTVEIELQRLKNITEKQEE